MFIVLHTIVFIISYHYYWLLFFIIAIIYFSYLLLFFIIIFIFSSFHYWHFLFFIIDILLFSAFSHIDISSSLLSATLIAFQGCHWLVFVIFGWLAITHCRLIFRLIAFHCHGFHIGCHCHCFHAFLSFIRFRFVFIDGYFSLRLITPYTAIIAILAISLPLLSLLPVY